MFDLQSYSRLASKLATQSITTATESFNTKPPKMGDIVEAGGALLDDNELLTKWNQQNYCPVFCKGENNKGGTHFTAYIKDTIDETDKYLVLLECLSTMTKDDTIEIFIDSPGGYIHTGTIIASYLRDCAGTTITNAIGVCASAGSLIWSSGKVCKVSPFAMFMWHMSTHMDWNNSVKVRDEAAFQVEYVKTVLLSQALAKGHITQEMVDHICQDPSYVVWISANEMEQRIRAKQAEKNGTSTEPIDLPIQSVSTDTTPSTGVESYLNTTTDQISFPTIATLTTPPPPQLEAQNANGVLRLIIKSTSPHEYRIYTSSDTRIESPIYQNKFCSFLENLNKDDTVTLHLGNLSNDNQPSYYLHSMIHAITKCEGTVKTYATGRCGATESVLWVFGHELLISPYGSLMFVGSKFVIENGGAMWEDYFHRTYETAYEKSVISTQALDELMTSNTTVHVTYADLKHIKQTLG